jgi:indoleamine 2,3-dioxygenase
VTVSRCVRLADYEVDERLGFLPGTDPLRKLPAGFAAWDEIASVLPKHLVMGQARGLLRGVPPLDIRELATRAERERAMLLLSYFAHAYVNDGESPSPVLPANIAVPWHAVASELGRPPILSYATQQLHNWGRLDPAGGVELSNLIRLQDFLGGMDDDWFVMVHVAIEAAAAAGLCAMVEAQDAVIDGDANRLADRLRAVTESLSRMQETLARMPERCDPYIYYNRVRLFLFGWKNNPAFPDGLLYEGVDAYGGRPQQFSGETGAQSAIIPFFTTALGVEHQHDPLNDYMLSLRDYMPPRHRAFIEEVGTRVDIRGAVVGHRIPEVVGAYDECIAGLREFHQLHLRYAANYVHKQGRGSDGNPTDTGTGGTPFMKYLRLHLDNIAAHAVGAGPR